jgi:hypothetical protein
VTSYPERLRRNRKPFSPRMTRINANIEPKGRRFNIRFILFILSNSLCPLRTYFGRNGQNRQNESSSRRNSLSSSASYPCHPLPARRSLGAKAGYPQSTLSFTACCRPVAVFLCSLQPGRSPFEFAPPVLSPAPLGRQFPFPVLRLPISAEQLWFVVLPPCDVPHVCRCHHRSSIRLLFLLRFSDTSTSSQ